MVLARYPHSTLWSSGRHCSHACSWQDADRKQVLDSTHREAVAVQDCDGFVSLHELLSPKRDNTAPTVQRTRARVIVAEHPPLVATAPALRCAARRLSLGSNMVQAR
jgi:hypothetical protein